MKTLVYLIFSFNWDYKTEKLFKWWSHWMHKKSFVTPNSMWMLSFFSFWFSILYFFFFLYTYKYTYILQINYRNTTLRIDVCANNRKVETIYAQKAVNLFVDAKGPCGADGNYFNDENLFAFLIEFIFLLNFFLVFFFYSSISLFVCLLLLMLNIGSIGQIGTINVEIRMVCSETESRSFYKDVSRHYSLQFLFSIS